MSFEFASSVPVTRSKRSGRQAFSLSAKQSAELRERARAAGLAVSKYVAQELGLSPVGPPSKSRRRYPPEIRRKAVELYEAGLSISQVSKEVGVPRTSIRNWLTALGVQTRAVGTGL